MLRFSFFVAVFAVFALSALMTVPARAQDDAVQSFAAEVGRLNLTAPETSARFERPQWFIGRDILDSTRSVIGKAEDFLVDGTGVVRQVVANVNVPGAGRQTLYFDFANVVRQDISHVYELPLHRQEIAENLPSYLNAIATAAGPEGDIFSLKRAEQGKILSDSGRVIANISAVLLNDDGRRIEALLLDNISGVMGFGKVAIPFDSGVLRAGEDLGKIVFYMPDAYEKALTDYARSSRR